MKKLVKSVLMLSIASLAILSSCKKDDANAEVTDVKVDATYLPSIPVENGVVTLTVTCTGNTDNNLLNISVKRSGGNLADKTVLSKSLSGTSSTETIVDTVGAGTFTYVIAVNGKTGSPATKIVTVTTRSLPKQLDVSNPTPLFGQTNGGGTNANFMSLSSPISTWSTDSAVFAANKSKMDVAFFYGATNKATLTSPSDATMQGLYTGGGISWAGVNTTLLYKTTMTTSAFDAIVASNSDSLITSMAAGITTWGSSINVLAQGNVILYKTSTNKLGLIKVDNLTGTQSNDAEINLVVISQKP